jgi:uncharacterized protein YukE
MSNREHKLEITPDEASRGVTKTILIDGRRIEISIPPDTQNGTTLRLRNSRNYSDFIQIYIIVNHSSVSPQKPTFRHYVKAFRGWGIAFVLVLVVIVITSLSNSSNQNPRYVYEGDYINVGADGEPIELIDNPQASDPTYAELISFLKIDNTDSKDYLDSEILGYVCADYAEDVHNNAEANGIKAAWVSIDLKGEEEGHACNAFMTIDKGLVFVDCTGSTMQEKMHLQVTDDTDYSIVTSFDTIAYIEKGKEYGTIDIKYAKLSTYDYYLEFNQKWLERDELVEEYILKVEQAELKIDRWAANLDNLLRAVDTSYNIDDYEVYLSKLEKYNDEVEEYNNFVANIENQLKQIESKVYQLDSELGDYCNEPLGIVEDYQIHW